MNNNDYAKFYIDYCNSGFATATGLSAMMNNEIIQNQVTRFFVRKGI